MVVLKFLLRSLLDRLHLTALAGDLYNKFVYFLSFHIRIRNSRFRKARAPDGLPLPTPQMVYLVTGQFSLEPFLVNGSLGAQCIRNILTKNGLNIREFNSILDFGCGCGRVLRHWSELKTSRLYGIDYNPYPILWCRKAFPFAEFSVNHMQTPLDYQEGHFDFIYAISVFTHLTVTSQQFWINELRRVLKPGGYLYLTTMGESYLLRLKLKEQELFKAGHAVVKEDRFNGNNFCGAFLPEAYVHQVLANGFHVVDFIPEGAKDAKLDVFLLRKPA